jgi:hypothetical protein
MINIFYALGAKLHLSRLIAMWNFVLLLFKKNAFYKIPTSRGTPLPFEQASFEQASCTNDHLGIPCLTSGRHMANKKSLYGCRGALKMNI